MATLFILPSISLFLTFTTAMPWLEPSATSVNAMASAGISLRPTEAPELNGIPKELLRRQISQLPSTPPDNWCGFITGDPNNILSCAATKTCVYSSYAVGCCDAGLIATCTGLFTTCVGYSDTCGSACKSNAKVLKCSYTDSPYCGTYSFSGGTANYNCGPTIGFVSSVEFLGDYYYSNLGITLGATAGPLTVTVDSESLTAGSAAATSASGTAAATSASGTVIDSPPLQSSSSPSADASTTTSHAIGVGAIAGIAVGAAIVILAIIAALIAWCCIRRRRRRRQAAMQRPAHLPPVITAAATAPPQPTQPQMSQQQQPQPEYGSQQQHQQDPKYHAEPAYSALDTDPTNDPYALPAKPSPYNTDTAMAPAAAAFDNDKHNHDPYQNLPAAAAAAAVIGPPQYSPPASLPAPNPNTHEISGQPVTDYYKHPNPSVSEVQGYTAGHGAGGGAGGVTELGDTISPMHTGQAYHPDGTNILGYAAVPVGSSLRPDGRHGSEADISELGTPTTERRARTPLPGAGRHGSEGGVSELGSPVAGIPRTATVSPLQTGGPGPVQRSAGLFGGEYPPGVYEVDGGAGEAGHSAGLGAAVAAERGGAVGQGGGPRPARNVYEMS